MAQSGLSTHTMTNRVGIVGAGRIAAGFDAPGDAQTLTHANAVFKEKRLELVGFWDLDPAAAHNAAQKWSAQHFVQLNDLLHTKCDLIVVATPDHAHEDNLRSIANCTEHQPRLVICEKPLTQNLASAQSIVELYAERKIPLLVNFQRRFDSTVRQLKQRIDNGSLGKTLGGVVWYSKGTKHNGSHAIDLLRFLFGEPQTLAAHSWRKDFTEDDPIVAGHLAFDRFSVALVPGDESHFSLFEIDLLFEKARYRFTHSGLNLELLQPQPDPVFAGYTELFTTHSGKTNLSDALGNMMSAAADYLQGGALASNTAADALKTQTICTKLIDLALNQN